MIESGDLEPVVGVLTKAACHRQLRLTSRHDELVTADDQAAEIARQLEQELGADMAAAFLALDEAIRNGRPIDDAGFRAAAFAYFDREFAAHRNPDPFFNWFGAIALPRPGTPLALTGLWEWAIAIALDWEASRGHHQHKGTGYYFAGVRDIALGDIDRGSLYMHQAAIEDTYPDRDRIPESPAGWFITLDASRADQAYHEKVAEYEAYLERWLTAYRAAGLGLLAIGDLRTRLKTGPGLLDAAATLAHVVARLTRLEPARISPIVDNRLGTLLLSQIALELCLVIEDLLRRRLQLELAFGGLVAQYPAGHQIALMTNELGSLNGLAVTPTGFDSVVGELLGGAIVTGFSRPLSDREMNLTVAYLVRNKAAHGLARPDAIVRRFDDVVAGLFFALFAAIEDLF